MLAQRVALRERLTQVDWSRGSEVVSELRSSMTGAGRALSGPVPSVSSPVTVGGLSPGITHEFTTPRSSAVSPEHRSPSH